MPRRPTRCGPWPRCGEGGDRQAMATDTVTGPVRVVTVQLPPRTVGHDLRAMRIVWQRELIRFVQDRPRIIVGLVQPVLFLFVLGTGLSRLASASTGGLSLRTFIFPGV